MMTSPEDSSGDCHVVRPDGDRSTREEDSYSSSTGAIADEVMVTVMTFQTVSGSDAAVLNL